MKYVTRPIVADDDGWWSPLVLNHLQVDGPEYIPTGILTADGEMICHCPPPIGFGRDEEW